MENDTDKYKLNFWQIFFSTWQVRFRQIFSSNILTTLIVEFSYKIRFKIIKKYEVLHNF